jgi:hypothetical protein
MAVAPRARSPQSSQVASMCCTRLRAEVQAAASCPCSSLRCRGKWRGDRVDG